MTSFSASKRSSSYVHTEDESKSLVDHFEQVQCRIDGFVKQSKSLAVILKKRMSVDKEHVKSVQKMVQSIHDDGQTKHMKFQGQLDTSWNSIKEQLTSEALHVSRVTSTLEQQAYQPLQVFLISDLEKRFRSLVADGRKALKELHSTKVAMQKSMDKYYSVVSDWEGVLLELFQEQGDTWNPAPGNKLHDKEAGLSKKVQEGKADYEAAVEHLNQLQNDIYNTHLPAVLDELRTTAQNMVAIVNNSLKCFSEMQSKLLPTNGSKVSAHDQFNAAEYCQTVIFCNIDKSNIPLPPGFDFLEFPFKDETLIMQARKTQYMCMSKLSPKELASRAHHFLNDTGKAKQLPIAETSVAREEGSKLLISLCITYLKQPVALKEEGLFRVSGDAAVMKSLHTDFMSGKASKEFLVAALRDQRDPNTVSGLLKLHLRENCFLGRPSISALEAVVQTADRSQILPVVLEQLSSTELRVITDIMSVLSLMVQSPWKEQNKMTAHTLGIACGLSVFPALDPNKATVLTEFLISNYDELSSSHSVL